MLASERGIRLEFIPVNGTGLLDMQVYEKLLKQEPRLVAFTHMSNVLGTINPAAEIIQKAHAVGAITLLDGAQSVPHIPVDVQSIWMWISWRFLHTRCLVQLELACCTENWNCSKICLLFWEGGI